MAADPFDALRLTLMEDLLPVGIAVVDRARRGGPRQVVEAFTASGDPLRSCVRREMRPPGPCARASIRCNQGSATLWSGWRCATFRPTPR